MKRSTVLSTPIHVLLFFTITFSIAPVGCDFDKPIRLGYIGSISGHTADIGISARDAVQLAVEQCNAQGGVGGRQIELIVKDDQQRAETAVNAVAGIDQGGCCRHRRPHVK